jgi:Ca2+-binding RTX toxin-like protein
MLRVTVTLCALLLALALPAAASAGSTAKFVPRDLVNGPEFPEDADPSFVEVNGDAGVNTIGVQLSGGVVTITDTSGITARSRCTQVSPTSVTCPKPDTSYVYAKDGDDHVQAVPSLRTEVEGGAGADVVTTAGAIRGGDGPDVLTGNGSGGELIDGEAGDDRLIGGDGDESMIGGPGADTLQGGAGNDQLDGDDPAIETYEADVIDGGAGRDTLNWSGRSVPVTVDLANAAPDGAAGENEQLSGIEIVNTGSGDDTLVGTDAPESFDPGPGTDSVSSGGGDDYAESSDGADGFDLGAGSDTISFRFSQLPVTVDLADPGPDGAKGSLDTLAGVENVIGSQPQDDFKGDTLIGNDEANIIVGLLGSDRLSGGGGNDRLYGEGRPIDIDGSPADGAQIELSYPARDKLAGGAGDDVLEGGVDSDLLDGGLGNDRIVGDMGRGFVGREPRSAGARDVVDYHSRAGRIRASTRSGGGARGEADSYRGIEGIRGGSGNDVLSGQRARSDFLSGGRGNDRLNGLSGKDTLRGQAGSDALTANDGERDKVDCGTGRDSYRADAKDKVKACERAKSVLSANDHLPGWSKSPGGRSSRPAPPARVR